MQNIELTPPHILGFIYISFAHQTDGELSQEELKIIWQKLRNQTGELLTYIQFAHLMDEVLALYRHKMLDDNIIDFVLEMAEQLTELDWFNRAKRVACLKDLKQIALADEKFLESEKRWILKLSEIWNINRRTLNSL